MDLNKLITKRTKEYALNGEVDLLDKYGFLFNMIAEDYHKQQLRIGVVSSMFSAKQMEQAFNDGVESEQQRCGEFNIENYC